MKHSSILLNAPSLTEIETVCDVLNANQTLGVRLRELVRAWQESGPNLQKLLFADQQLNRIVRQSLRILFRPSTTGGADLELTIDPLAFGPDYYEGLKHFHRRPPEDGLAALRSEQEAVRLFVSLTLSQAWNRLGGPCDRCHRYFVKTRANQKRYCSSKCGHNATAKAVMTARRQRERLKKLQLARRAVKRWKATLGVDAKEFVSGQTGLSRGWLTHAVNTGELRLSGTKPQAAKRI